MAEEASREAADAPATDPVADYDSPWKAVLAQFLPDALALFAPAAHTLIDWSRPYDLLDQELQQISVAGVNRKRVVDLLARVALLSGETRWLLVHVEVQGQRVSDFAKRMFTYHYRLLDRFDEDVLSMALLIDRHAGWRPGAYERGGPLSRIRFDYTVVKLLDWRDRLDELAASANPFAIVVRAHLLALQTRGDHTSRFGPRLALARELYARGFDQPTISALLRFIDWIVRLPPALEQLAYDELEAVRGAKGMPYVTSYERIAREKGREEGREEGRELGAVEGQRKTIALLLRRRFGAEGAALAAALDQVASADDLDRITLAVSDGVSLDALRALVQELSA